jgi:glutaredoxin-related protein
MENFEDFYEEWIDQINQSPLVTERINEFDEVININQQIVNNIYNIRRFLELRDTRANNYTRSYTSSYSRSYSNGPYETTVDFDMDVDPNIDNLFRFDGTQFLNNLFDLAFNETVTTDYEDVKVTLSDEDFQKFKTETINQTTISVYSDKDCNICMDEYKNGDSVTHLTCKHVFHTDCIKNWLCNEKITCPVCRKDTRET